MPSQTSITTATVRLNDGRTLAYGEHGEPSGAPVVFFHGTPGSRLYRHPDDSIAASLGARVITVDRPGFGLSDFKPGRELFDWPDDVVELANALNLGRFAVAGVSGGAPYVAACALKIPNRLTAAAMISSVGPLDAPVATDGMLWYLRLLFGLADHSGIVSRLCWWLATKARSRNSGWLRAMEANGLPSSETRMLERPEMMMMLAEDYAEAVRHGVRGVAWDMAVLAHPWGCCLADITMPIQIWHGDQDVRATLNMGRYLVSIIPNCQATFFAGEGHDVFYNHWDQILAALLQYRTTESNAVLPGDDNSWWAKQQGSVQIGQRREVGTGAG